ncbi:glycoside hydrolase family 18 protein, partial [bacterium]|nr:glycoside hydrolase family 18 protein [bacterium]
MKVYIFLLTICFVSVDALRASQVCPTPVPDKYKHVQPGNILLGFFAGADRYQRKYTVKDVYPIAHELTHLVYVFAKPDTKTGKAVLQDPYGDVGANYEFSKSVGGNFADLQELKKKFPHLKILLSLGGGKYNKRFLDIADAGKLRTLANSMVDLLDQFEYEYENPETGKKGSHCFHYHGLFDGIDLDWEFGSGDKAEKYAQQWLEFIQEMHHVLHKKKKHAVLTVDIEVNPKVYTQLPLTQAINFVDWYNVMAYDFYSPRNDSVGLNAPICGTYSVYSIDGALYRLMDLGISPEKMVLALPLYGHVYTNANGFLTQYKKDEDAKPVMYYHLQKKFLQNPKFEKKWHPSGQVPSAYNAKEKVFVSYDDHESLKLKVEHGCQKHVKGYAVWRLSGDDEYNSLLKEIIRARNSC